MLEIISLVFLLGMWFGLVAFWIYVIVDLGRLSFGEVLFFYLWNPALILCTGFYIYVIAGAILNA